MPLADVYAIFSFYLRHRADIESYLGDRSKSESRCRSGSNRSTRLTGFARHCSPGSIRPRCADSPGMHEALQEHLQRSPSEHFTALALGNGAAILERKRQIIATISSVTNVLGGHPHTVRLLLNSRRMCGLPPLSRRGRCRVVLSARSRGARRPLDRRSGLCWRSETKTLRWLAGDAGDEVEVLVQVQHGKPSEFSSGGNQQVGDRRCAVLALAGQCKLDLNCSVFNRRRHVLNWHRRDRRGREYGLLRAE